MAIWPIQHHLGDTCRLEVSPLNVILKWALTGEAWIYRRWKEERGVRRLTRCTNADPTGKAPMPWLLRWGLCPIPCGPRHLGTQVLGRSAKVRSPSGSEANHNPSETGCVAIPSCPPFSNKTLKTPTNSHRSLKQFTYSDLKFSNMYVITPPIKTMKNIRAPICQYPRRHTQTRACQLGGHWLALRLLTPTRSSNTLRPPLYFSEHQSCHNRPKSTLYVKDSFLLGKGKNLIFIG